MRLAALFILTAAIAYPAFAQPPKGVTACRVESVNQTNGVTTITGVIDCGVIDCKDPTVSSTGQTGGVTAGSIGSVVQDSGPKPKANTIALCHTAPVLDITVKGKVMTVTGGRRCLPNEQPSIVIDLATYAIVGGTNRGTVNMSISSN